MREIYENSAEYREVPHMTRSEYVDEYGEIIDYYQKQREEEKKFLPLHIVVAVLSIGVILYCIFTKSIVGMFILLLLFAPFTHKSQRFYRRYGLSIKERIKISSLSFFFLFPLGSYFARIKQIDDTEKKQIQDLEDRKKLCIEIGTYNAEE